MSLQSATGEVLRLKRMRRMSSEDDSDLREAKVAANDLAYYSANSPNSGVGATIALPSGVTWTQADLEHAAAISGK